MVIAGREASSKRDLGWEGSVLMSQPGVYPSFSRTHGSRQYLRSSTRSMLTFSPHRICSSVFFVGGYVQDFWDDVNVDHVVTRGIICNVRAQPDAVGSSLSEPT